MSAPDPVTATGRNAALTLLRMLECIRIVDAHIDANTAQEYRNQPLAGHWTRITKVCEEAGEVWAALSKCTGENARKGVCGTWDDLLGELGDTVMAAACAIQHVTKGESRTLEVIVAAAEKAMSRTEPGRAEVGQAATEDKRPPEQGPPPPVFSHHAYGVDLDWFEFDGGMIARGHVPDLRFIAACNHMARTETGVRNLANEHGASLEDVLALVTRAWAVPQYPQDGSEWAVRYGQEITEQTPGAIPVTVMLP